jgi:hypothetical protein
MKNIINEYNDLYDYLLPIIKNKYNECAADPNYEPEPHSDGPYIIDKDQLILQHIKITPEGFEFCLQTFNSDAEVQGTFYITIEDPEVYKNSNKYNL